MRGRQRISKRLKLLGSVAIAAAVMAASAQAATVLDLTSGLGVDHTGLPAPASLMIVGTVLLATFRARPQA